MGLLDFLNTDDARLGINLLGAASPTMHPVGFGARLAGAMNATDEQKRQREEDKLRQEYRDLQMEEMRRNNRIQDDQLELQKRFMGAVGPLMSPQSIPVPLPKLGEQQGQGDYRLNVETPEQRANLSKQLDYLAKNDPETHKQVLAALVAQGMPPPVEQRKPDWNALANISAQGQLLGIKGASGLMELAKLGKPDIQMVDTGNGIVPMDKNGQMPSFIPKGMSPDAAAANQLGWANNAVSQFNATKPVYHDGALVGPDGAITKTPMYAPPKGSPEATAQSSAKVIPLLKEADNLLNDATGSYGGAALDAAGRLVGISTKGAQASAKLKALEGAIMMAQPRMEGPQSDKDVALYRQMAGQIGDPTLPIETRRAALEGIKQMHEAYSGQQQSQGQSGVRKYNPATGRIE
jgi:hypothetical protein